ncbi:hypothetical protein HK100_012621 [Physocladia obscura]|uniref:Uncharacterized protein n=1 Tax=Physocladia obscura TaxID=109957 RepID=A0AAD5XHP0_9FUNG|nr:hypothetical protein HK100_012621 [Physocladia obscura]
MYNNDTELITGLLILLQDTYIHVVEASEKVVGALMRELCGILPANFPKTTAAFDTAIIQSGSFLHPKAESKSNCSLYFSESKVLLIASDITSRSFTFWASRIIELGVRMAPFYVDEMMFNEDNLEKTLSNLCLGLCTIGSGLSVLSKADLKQAMDDIQTKFADVLPRNETIKYIINECHNIVDISEWSAIYDEHMDPRDAAEYVWPVPKMIEV